MTGTRALTIDEARRRKIMVVAATVLLAGACISTAALARGGGHGGGGHFGGGHIGGTHLGGGYGGIRGGGVHSGRGIRHGFYNRGFARSPGFYFGDYDTCWQGYSPRVKSRWHRRQRWVCN